MPRPWTPTSRPLWKEFKPHEAEALGRSLSTWVDEQIGLAQIGEDYSYWYGDWTFIIAKIMPGQFDRLCQNEVFYDAWLRAWYWQEEGIIKAALEGDIPEKIALWWLEKVHGWEWGEMSPESQVGAFLEKMNAHFSKA